MNNEMLTLQSVALHLRVHPQLLGDRHGRVAGPRGQDARHRRAPGGRAARHRVPAGDLVPYRRTLTGHGHSLSIPLMNPNAQLLDLVA